MVVELSKGQLFLNKYTRSIRRKVEDKMFEGVTLNPMAAQLGQEQEMDIPVNNLRESAELAMKLMIKKIRVEDKEFGYGDLDKLEEDGVLTNEDIVLIESSVSEATSGDKVKKN